MLKMLKIRCYAANSIKLRRFVLLIYPAVEANGERLRGNSGKPERAGIGWGRRARCGDLNCIHGQYGELHDKCYLIRKLRGQVGSRKKSVSYHDGR